MLDREGVWQRVSRPHRRLELTAVLEGMERLRQEFTGQLWMEVMLVAGANDGEAELEAIHAALQRVAPDRVYVNVPVRPPAESWVEPPGAEGMVRAREILGDGVFIDFAEEGEFDTAGFATPLEGVTAIVRRHPMRIEQIQATLARFDQEELRKALDADITSKEWEILSECYSNNPAWEGREEMRRCLVERIKAGQFEFGEAKISGNRADVILKNNAGQTLTLGFVKEADDWRLDRIPDKRPWYKKLLNPILLIPVFTLILVLTLWRRRSVIKAMEQAKEE